MNQLATPAYRLIALIAALVVMPAIAQPLGDHPAVMVAKQWQARGYDYQANFYPHPARLTLLAEAPHTMSEHPALTIKRTWNERGYDYASKFYAHPARLALLSAPPAIEQPTTIAQPVQADHHSMLDVGFRLQALPFAHALFDPA
jgi:hypothetical protein